MATAPRLIEVALPIREISAESVRDKSLRHGHISTLHLWFARRSLARLARTQERTSWPCKVGSAKDTIHWMAPDFNAPLDEVKELT